MRLTQRRINLLVFGWLFAMALLGIPIFFFLEQDRFSATFTVAMAACIGTLSFAYWRGWQYARHGLVLLLSVAAPFGLTEPYLTQATSVVPLVPVGLALLLLNPWWVAGSWLLALGVLSARLGVPNIYLVPASLIINGAIVGLMILSRLAVDNALQLEEARRQAEAARNEAEQARHDAEARALEIEARNAEQERLLALVSALETPAVEIADRVLLASIVGAVDTQRLARLSTRLLEAASTHRPELVVIDIAGVTLVDAQIAEGLLRIVRALRLLGCPATISGISAETAITLTRLQVDLDEVTTTRSPQEALRLHLGSHAPAHT